MKLSLDRSAFLLALTSVARFADDGRGLLTFSPSVTTVTSGGRESGACHTLAGATTEDEGEATIPLETLARWLKDSIAEQVTVIVTGRGVIVHGAEGERLGFPLDDPKTVPVMEIPSDAACVTLDADEFHRVVGCVEFASPKPNMNAWSEITIAIQVSVSGGVLKMIATDTIHLAIAAADVQGDDIQPVLIRATIMRAWAKTTYKGNESLRLWSNGAAFTAGPLTAWTSIIVKKPPRFPPETRRHIVDVPLQALTRAVRVAIVGSENEDEPLVQYLVAQVEPGRMTLRGDNRDKGLSSAVELALPGYTGETLSVILDGARLDKYLKVVGSRTDEEIVSLRYETASLPVEFAAGKRSWYLTMPSVMRE